eukprot:8541119-Pyramimonas_sp.AAC.1
MPCGPCRWGLRWSSLPGHETCEECAGLGVELHADFAAGAFGGAPFQATKRVSGVLNRVRVRHADPAAGTF